MVGLDSNRINDPVNQAAPMGPANADSVVIFIYIPFTPNLLNPFYSMPHMLSRKPKRELMNGGAAFSRRTFKFLSNGVSLSSRTLSANPHSIGEQQRVPTISRYHHDETSPFRHHGTYRFYEGRVSKEEGPWNQNCFGNPTPIKSIPSE